ncbi:MAG: hypothetical protein O2856_09550, partial [Planctomycetota bacterium]|nr:hypothetical protein [Planctomycetota bacterium]
MAQEGGTGPGADATGGGSTKSLRNIETSKVDQSADRRVKAGADVIQGVETFSDAVRAGTQADAAALVDAIYNPLWPLGFDLVRDRLNGASIHFATLEISEESGWALASSQMVDVSGINPMVDTALCYFVELKKQIDQKWLVTGHGFQSPEGVKETHEIFQKKYSDAFVIQFDHSAATEGQTPARGDNALQIYNLLHADAVFVAGILNRLIRTHTTTIVAVPDTNSIIARGESVDLEIIADLMPHLDQPAAKQLGGQGNTNNKDYPNVETLRQKATQGEELTAKIAHEVKAAPGESGDVLRSRLRSEVQSSFEARQQLQRAELQKLRQQLERIEQSIETRERIKDEIINHRVAELLNPELQWKPSGGNVSVRARTTDLGKVTELRGRREDVSDVREAIEMGDSHHQKPRSVSVGSTGHQTAEPDEIDSLPKTSKLNQKSGSEDAPTRFGGVSEQQLEQLQGLWIATNIQGGEPLMLAEESSSIELAFHGAQVLATECKADGTVHHRFDGLIALRSGKTRHPFQLVLHSDERPTGSLYGTHKIDGDQLVLTVTAASGFRRDKLPTALPAVWQFRRKNAGREPFSDVTIDARREQSEIAWGAAGANGLQAGVRVEPRNQANAAGQLVTPVFYYRNTGHETLEISFPRLMTESMYDRVVSIDAFEREIRIEKKGNFKRPVGRSVKRLAPGERHELRGLPIMPGDISGAPAETAIRVQPGLTATVRFLVPDFGTDNAEPLLTGELLTVVDVPPPPNAIENDRPLGATSKGQSPKGPSVPTVELQYLEDANVIRLKGSKADVEAAVGAIDRQSHAQEVEPKSYPVLSGVGLALYTQEGHVYVGKVVPKSPADESGLIPEGARLISIEVNGKDTLLDGKTVGE